MVTALTKAGIDVPATSTITQIKRLYTDQFGSRSENSLPEKSSMANSQSEEQPTVAHNPTSVQQTDVNNVSAPTDVVNQPSTSVQ